MRPAFSGWGMCPCQPLERSSSPRYVRMPNLVTLGQMVWLYIEGPKNSAWLEDMVDLIKLFDSSRLVLVQTLRSLFRSYL